MFLIYQHPPTGNLIITDSPELTNALVVKPDQLNAFRARLMSFLDDSTIDAQTNTLPAHLPPPPSDEYISPPQAVALAADQGITLPHNTITLAIRKRKIPGGYKAKGRYYLPRAGFLDWLEHEYRPRPR